MSGLAAYSARSRKPLSPVWGTVGSNPTPSVANPARDFRE
jgi:hypothetical protein